jgi:hypothetical protein
MASIAEPATAAEARSESRARAPGQPVAAHSSGRAAPAWTAIAAGALIAGVYLRATQLPAQILLDDEWHAIHKLLHSGAKGILTSFGVADYSIPLTLYYRFLALHGGLSEWAMHVPLLVAGVALLAVAPLLLRREAAPPVLATWVALLAISPLLVYLSRTARPYALTCLLAFVAVIAFRRWWRKDAHPLAWAFVYVAATFLAGWLHLVTLPFTLLPFAYATIRTLAVPGERDRAHAMLRLIRLGAITVLPLLAALLPPFLGSAVQLAEKTGSDGVTLDSVYRSGLMLIGTGSPWPFALACVLLLAGVRRLARRNGDFIAYVAFLSIGLAVALVFAKPAWVSHPLVFARYMLPALPFALLFVAEGAVACAAAAFARTPVQAATIAIAVLLLFLAGPIPRYLYYPNQFIEHARFQFDYDDAHNPYVQQIPSEPIPAFYRTLAKRPPGSSTLIEAPWRLESNFIPFPWYQAVHRQNVMIGLVTPVCGVRDFGEYSATETRLRFRNFAHLSEILRGRTYGADYLVMHVKPWTIPPNAPVEWPDVAACLPAIEATLGAPVFRDDAIVVFDLAGPR